MLNSIIVVMVYFTFYIYIRTSKLKPKLTRLEFCFFFD